MKTGIKVHDAMTEKPVKVPHDMLVEQCIELMRDYHVSSVVVEKRGRVLGICTDHDISQKDVHSSLVQDVMSREVETVSPESDVFDALMRMKKSSVRDVAVMDGEKLLGVLTLGDILSVEPSLYEVLSSHLDLVDVVEKGC